MLLYATPGMAVWPAAMIVWGPGFYAAAHRHHCVQLVMALHGSLRVRGGSEDAWTTCGAVLVRPDAEHEVDAGSTAVLIGFIDAESEIGTALSDRIGGNLARVPSHEIARWRAVLGRAPSKASAERWLTQYLLRRKRAVRMHPRVRRVLAYLKRPHALLGDTSLKTLAAVGGLSRSRFMHVFTESVGVPVRPYVLWLRLQRAACDLVNGASVTSAAHAAGFSDAAHLTRTFRRMLGTTPTDIALRNKQSLGLSLETGVLEPVARERSHANRLGPPRAVSLKRHPA